MNVVIVHGWEGHPDEGWFPWLKEELTKKGHFVNVLKMPHPDEPVIAEWVSFLEKNVIKETILIGHSIGCQTILRFLEKTSKKIPYVFFIAGWVTLQGLETQEEKEVAKPWLETPINYKKIRTHKTKFTAFFSDNDPYVPFKENSDIFKKELNAKIILEKEKGHFAGSDGISEIPNLLKELFLITLVKKSKLSEKDAEEIGKKIRENVARKFKAMKY